MVKATPEQIEFFSKAIADMQDGKIVIATVGGQRVLVTRLYFGADSLSGQIWHFDRLDTFESINEAKAFLKLNAIEQIAAEMEADTATMK